jgi:hypothetical protein
MSTFDKTERSEGFPTVLIAGNDDSLTVFVEALKLDGYLVLVASDCDAAVRVASIHSRPIHLLATDRSIDPRTLTERLKPLRLGTIPVLSVSGQPGAALAEVRKLIKPPPQSAKARGCAA